MSIFNFKNKKFGWHRQKKGGYTLVELLFYIALFSVLGLSVINALIAMTKAFRETSIHVELTQSSNILERISREIRNSSALSIPSAGNLVLDTTDDLGVAKTVEFELSGADVHLLEDDVLTGNLNSPNISVLALTFTEITTTEGKAVKVYLSVSSENDSSGRVVDFYNTVVLRQSY